MKRLLRKELFIWLGVLLVIILLPDVAEAGQWGVLAFRIVGSLVGSYFGGPMGGMIGGAIGGLIGGLIFGGEEGPKIKGPRLSDKSVQSAANGAFIMRTWGKDRVPAQIIFSSGLKEHKHKSEVGGKGMGGTTQTSITYTYSVDIMLSFGKKAKGVKRLWADNKLILDNTGSVSLKKKWLKAGRKFVIRDGNESQLPSALEESYHGVGLCSAHRGLFCLEAEDFDLTKLFFNHIPNFTAEIFTEGSPTFQKIASYQPPAAPYSYWVHSFGYVDPHGELWAMYYPYSTRYPYPGYASIFHWTLDIPSDPVEEFHPLWEGDVVQESSLADPVRLRSDEQSASAFGTNNLGIALSYFRLLDGGRVDFMHDDVPGRTVPRILVKYVDEFYVAFTGYTLSHPQTLVKYNEAGAVSIGSSVLVDNGILEPTDMGRSESYLWVLNGPTLYKLDADSLALLSTIDLSAITDSHVLAMAVVSDTEQRIVSASADGTKFWIVRNDGAPVLDQHDAVNTYSTIRGFGRWGLRYVEGIYIVDFAGYTSGFPALIDFFAEHAETEKVPHWKIVRDISIMAGADSVVDSVPPTVGDIDVDDLTDMEHGYTLTRPMSAREALVQLATCRFYDARETNLKIEFVKRGKAAVRTISGDDLAARSSITETLPDRLTHSRQRETECPYRLHVVYNNHEASYQPGHEYAPRQITDSRKTVTVEIGLALSPTEARQIADTLLAQAWLARETFTMRTGRKHLRLDAADNVEVEITET